MSTVSGRCDSNNNQLQPRAGEASDSDVPVYLAGLADADRLSFCRVSWLTNCCSRPHLGQTYRSIRIGCSPSSETIPSEGVQPRRFSQS